MTTKQNIAPTTPILAFDLDGTLLDSQDQIHPEDKRILQEHSSAFFVPATGRAFRSVKKLFNSLQVFNGQPIPLGAVTQNGAAVYLPGEQLLSYTHFAPEIQEALVDLAMKFPQVSFIFNNEDQSFVIWPNDFSRNIEKRYRMTFLPFSEARKPLSKMMGFSEDPGVLKEIADAGRDIPVERMYSMNFIYEFTPPGVDKGHGLMTLLEALNLSQHPIFAVGDNENDLGMLKLAHRSFAPKTCQQKIQEKADFVIDRSQEGLLRPMLRSAQL
jgi:Cof subfamily protein (haloacid dehalogenase superfamily)